TTLCRSGPFRSLENAAQDYACLLNDVFSYRKEIEYEGEIHNGVLVVQNFFGCGYPEALRIVVDLMESRMRQFQHVAAHELPILADGLGLDGRAREALDGYVRDLENWMSGILVWHRGCRRYDEESLRRHNRPFRGLPSGPTGLGTAALPVVSRLSRMGCWSLSAQPTSSSSLFWNGVGLVSRIQRCSAGTPGRASTRRPDMSTKVSAPVSTVRGCPSRR